ncbi:DUF3291 domain-containing protein [Dactylosporangium sp. AC04546]|uniref:DUF3291 domain-containing protein n=1 Tax=Dactylosporangium sp. AC04546 TaxID=2862460 RepID=UPI001EDD8CF0|nr:DUF3291 domain-containing protein [Dactylosporangium sp. AC04546]WVK85325.1 DUF3291 domain-containing protein [Dactylosporangium sp. AC04546]
MTSHLAQLNVGRMIAAQDDPRVADFYGDLDRINAIADASPGFVWRLVDGGGADATSLRPFGPDVLVNLSVWESLDALREFAFRSPHLDVLRRRREWFEPFGDVYAVLWWVPAGHTPTTVEAGERLDLLRRTGATADAFTFRDPFPAPITAG